MNNEKIFLKVFDKIVDNAGRGVKPWSPGWRCNVGQLDRDIENGVMNERRSFSPNRNPNFSLNPYAEHILKRNGADIEFGYDGASYNIRNDKINFPGAEKFFTVDGYYSTLFHEMTHRAGHPGRLNRQSLVGAMHHSELHYCVEEMTAELGGAFINGMLGMDHTDTNARYVFNFLAQEGRGDIRLLNKAVEQAAEAANYIIAQSN